jgi:hypothetical protein
VTTASDRVQVAKFPVAAPGVCVICRSAGDGFRDFIDFGFQIDYYGAVYFCSECIIPVVIALGYVSESKIEDTVKENTDLKKNLQLKTEMERVLKNAIVSFASADNNESFDVDAFLRSSISPVSEPSDTGERISEDAENTGGSNSDSSLEGFDDIFSLEESSDSDSDVS